MKKKIKLLIIDFVIIICLFGIIYSGYNIITWKIDNDKNRDIKKELDTSIELDEIDKKYNIDWEKLKKQNPDTVGYIKVNNTNIDYVVVQTKDNNYYLKHNFNKETNKAGWIFVDFRNELDNNDKNIVIYGHDTRNGSMFGTLGNVIKSNWYTNKDNHIIEFVTENNSYRYQVFSTYSIKPEDYYIKTDFKNEKEYLEFLKEIESRSIYNYKILLNENDKILTLSSCLERGKKRVVLHAKLIEE